MLGLSMTELVIILGLALLLLGPDQLPSLAKSLGKGMRELRKATDDIKSTFEQEMARVDLDEQPRMMAPVPPPASGAKVAPADPGEARALARMAAVAPVAAAPAAQASEEPAAAASEPAAPQPTTLRLVAPEGTVPRGGGPTAGPAAAAGDEKKP